MSAIVADKICVKVLDFIVPLGIHLVVLKISSHWNVSGNLVLHLMSDIE